MMRGILQHEDWSWSNAPRKGGGGSAPTPTAQNTSISNQGPPPAFMTGLTGALGQAAAVGTQPYQQYQGNLLAPLSPQQIQGINLTASTPGLAAPFINAAAQHMDAATQPLWGQLPQYSANTLAQYFNPYVNQVVGSTQAEFENQNEQAANQLRGNAASQGALGGDRPGVAQAVLRGQEDLAQNPVIANLYNQGFQQQQQEFNQQQQAQLGALQANAWLNSQAGFGLGQLGNEALNSTLTSANALMGVGGLEQQQAQQSLNIPFEQFQAAQAFPYQQTGWLSGEMAQLANAAGGTSSLTQPSPSTFSQLAGLGLGAAGIAGQAGAFKGLGSSIGNFFGDTTGGLTPGTTAAQNAGLIDSGTFDTGGGGGGFGDVPFDTNVARGGRIIRRDDGGVVPDQFSDTSDPSDPGLARLASTDLANSDFANTGLAPLGLSTPDAAVTSMADAGLSNVPDVSKGYVPGVPPIGTPPDRTTTTVGPAGGGSGGGGGSSDADKAISALGDVAKIASVVAMFANRGGGVPRFAPGGGVSPDIAMSGLADLPDFGASFVPPPPNPGSSARLSPQGLGAAGGGGGGGGGSGILGGLGAAAGIAGAGASLAKSIPSILSMFDRGGAVPRFASGGVPQVPAMPGDASQAISSSASPSSLTGFALPQLSVNKAGLDSGPTTDALNTYLANVKASATPPPPTPAPPAPAPAPAPAANLALPPGSRGFGQPLTLAELGVQNPNPDITSLPAWQQQQAFEIQLANNNTGSGGSQARGGHVGLARGGVSRGAYGLGTVGFQDGGPYDPHGGDAGASGDVAAHGGADDPLAVISDTTSHPPLPSGLGSREHDPASTAVLPPASTADVLAGRDPTVKPSQPSIPDLPPTLTANPSDPTYNPSGLAAVPAADRPAGTSSDNAGDRGLGARPTKISDVGPVDAHGVPTGALTDEQRALAAAQHPERDAFALPEDYFKTRAADRAKDKESNLWNAVMMAGFGMMGGTSPYPLVNMGRGAALGLQNYQSNEQAAKQLAARVDEARARLAESASYHDMTIGTRQYGIQMRAQIANRLADLKARGLDNTEEYHNLLIRLGNARLDERTAADTTNAGIRLMNLDQKREAQNALEYYRNWQMQHGNASLDEQQRMHNFLIQKGLTDEDIRLYTAGFDPFTHKPTFPIDEVQRQRQALTPSPLAGAAAKPGGRPAPGLVTPNDAQIKMLQGNNTAEMRKAFDDKFGAGAADKYVPQTANPAATTNPAAATANPLSA